MSDFDQVTAVRHSDGKTVTLVTKPSENKSQFKFQPPSNTHLAADTTGEKYEDTHSWSLSTLFSSFSRRNTQNLNFYVLLNAFSYDGIYLNLFAGQNGQRIVAAVDTSIDAIVLNPYNSTVAKEPNPANSNVKSGFFAGFDSLASKSFQGNRGPYNETTLLGSTIVGNISLDSVSFWKDGIMEDNFTFIFADSNNMYYRDIYTIGGLSESIAENEASLSYSNIPANIVGLSASNSAYSFLQQTFDLGYSSSKLLSMNILADGNATLLIGAIDVSKFTGVLAMQPILSYMFSEDSSQTGNEYPFITMTQLSLTNSQQNNTIRFSNSELVLPVLLDTTTPINYLPYSLIVYIASNVGAYYSSSIKSWVQDCSFRSANGSINFAFYNTTIKVPVSNLLIPLISESGDNLFFETGEQACALAFLPAESRGFSSLGTSFFQAAYTVFDFQNMLVGISPLSTNNMTNSSINVVTASVDQAVSATTFRPASTPTATIDPAIPSFSIPSNQIILSGSLSSNLATSDPFTSAPSVTIWGIPTKSAQNAPAITSIASFQVPNASLPASGTGKQQPVINGSTVNSAKLGLVYYAGAVSACLLFGLLL